jgi:hypothetical protein
MLLPDNAATELKRAYNSVVEAGVTHLWNHTLDSPIQARHVVALYQRAMTDYRTNTPESRLRAERWARAAKHLADALWHEAKIAYLRDRTAELPYLSDAEAEYHLHDETEDTAQALFAACSLIPEVNAGLELETWLGRGRHHLAQLKDPHHPIHELLRAERIKAANQYGRALECALLALEPSMRKPEKKAA